MTRASSSRLLYIIAACWAVQTLGQDTNSTSTSSTLPVQQKTEETSPAKTAELSSSTKSSTSYKETSTTAASYTTIRSTADKPTSERSSKASATPSTAVASSSDTQSRSAGVEHVDPNASQGTSASKALKFPKWALILVVVTLLVTGAVGMLLIYTSTDEQGNVHLCGDPDKSPHKGGYTGHVLMNKISKGKLEDGSGTETVGGSSKEPSVKKEENKAILSCTESVTPAAECVDFASSYECQQISEVDENRGLNPALLERLQQAQKEKQ